MTMTRKLNIDNGLQRRMKEHQAVTGGIVKYIYNKVKIQNKKEVNYGF